MAAGSDIPRTIPMTSTASERGPAILAATRYPSERETWLLVLAVTIPFWAYLALMRTVTFSLMTAGNPGIIIAPPHIRLLQHAILLPLLIVLYRYALTIGWPDVGRARAIAKHAAMALLFAFIARPVLITLVAADRLDLSLMGELVGSVFGRRLAIDLWISTGFDFLLSYAFGLAVLFGVKSYRELKYEKLRAANLRAAWTRSRLQALRMQLNPHFLFNALNAAVALVSTQPKTAEQVLVRLADLLRRTLREGESDLISLSRELDLVRTYLEIQRLRFADRLRYDIDVDPAARDAAVPSLLLQPLAENAVMHGMAADTDSVEIEVSVRRVPSGIELLVRNSANVALDADIKLGVGLGNTRDRLDTLFPGDHEMKLLREKDGSVVASVRIPYIEFVSREAA